MRILLILVLLLAQAALAQNYRFEPSGSGWSIRAGDREYSLVEFLNDERVTISNGPLATIEFNGKLGLLRDEKLAVPPLFSALGMTTYVGEVGWVHSTEILGGFTGYQGESGRWGLLDENGRVVTEPLFEEILYDGYFFSGHINPLEGMKSCRELADRNGDEVLGFALQERQALGYFNASGDFISL